jgi:hypothetical protein
MEMNSYSELLGLLQVEDLPVDALLQAVSAALDETAEDDPHFAALADIEARLLEGEDASAPLQEWAAAVLASRLCAVDELWAEMEQAVAELPEERWRAGRFEEFDERLECAEYLDSLQELMDGLREELAATRLSQDELTAETYVAQRLWMAGLECWSQAVLLARAEQDDEALSQAQQGSRWMLGLDILQARLQSAQVPGRFPLSAG